MLRRDDSHLRTRGGSAGCDPATAPWERRPFSPTFNGAHHHRGAKRASMQPAAPSDRSFFVGSYFFRRFRLSLLERTRRVCADDPLIFGMPPPAIMRENCVPILSR